MPNEKSHFSRNSGIYSRCFQFLSLRNILNNTGSVTTTTTIPIPQKDSAVLNAIGKEVSDLCGVPYLFSDFKKRGGYKRSIELSAQFSLYRQNYCGCVFSRR